MSYPCHIGPHPNVVTLHDAFEDDEFFYIILQFYPGGDLFDHICDKRTYVYNDALLRSAFVSLVDAVQACHDAKIYHRDLKPENVLTNGDGSEVYLADFGLATDRTIVNEFGCGTTIYMSPGKSHIHFLPHAHDADSPLQNVPAENLATSPSARVSATCGHWGSS